MNYVILVAYLIAVAPIGWVLWRLVSIEIIYVTSYYCSEKKYSCSYSYERLVVFKNEF